MNASSGPPAESETSEAEQVCYVLGVDGGGTKTEAWLARIDEPDQSTVLGRGKAGPSNPRAVGFETAMGHLSAAVDAALQDAGIAGRQVEIAVLALSGAGHATMRERIKAWANDRRLAARVEIVHDADPVLAAGTPDGHGVALIVGTGSAAIAADGRGRREVVGGWGFWYGDEGSAYWIGRRALEAVAQAADGRAEPTGLTAAICQRLNAPEPRAILGLLEQTGNVRGAMAALAAAVADAAAEGDEAALAIIDEAADELAAMVACAAGKLRLGNEFPLVLTGGVACGSTLLQNRLLDALHGQSIRPYPVQTIPHPVAGCIALASQMLRE